MFMEEETVDHDEAQNEYEIDPEDYQNIENVMRERHDLVHKFVCDQLNVDYGERPISQFFDFKDKEFELIENQTPDIVKIENNKVQLIDITISSSPFSAINKIKKYDYAKRVLSKLTNKEVSVEYVRIDPVTLEIDQSSHFIENLIQIQEKFDKINKKLMQLLQTSEGLKWHLDNTQFNSLRKKMNFEEYKVHEMYIKSVNKPFKDMEDMKSVLNSNLIVPEENEFLDFCLDSFEPKTSKLTVDSRPDIKVFWEFHKNMSNGGLINDETHIKENHKFRSYLPLPNLEGTKIDVSFERDTTLDSSEILSVLSLMKRSSDEFCRILSERSTPVTSSQAIKLKILNNYECYRKCNFSREEKNENFHGWTR